MNELKEMIWQEKYRPVSVKDVITPFTDQILNAMSKPMSIQNFIFYSRRGGTGKTSMSKAIVNDLKCDYLNLNASDERSIDTVRTKVKEFMLTKSSNPNCKKCIIMDEGEKLTKDAADALKNMLEEYSANCFIILTTNNINKIPEPLQTRFKILEFVSPDKVEVYAYLKNICEKENLISTNEGLNKLIDIHYPSIRKMINHLQDLFNQKKSISIENILKDSELYDSLWNLILQQDYVKAKIKILEEGIDCEELNNYIFENIGKLDLIKEIKIVPLLARNEKDFKFGCDKSMVFIATMIDIIKVLRG